MPVQDDDPLHEMVDFASVGVETTAFQDVLTSLIAIFNHPQFLSGIIDPFVD